MRPERALAWLAIVWLMEAVLGCGGATRGATGRAAAPRPAPWLEVRTFDVAEAYFGERALALVGDEAACESEHEGPYASGPLCHARMRLRGWPEAFEPYEARLLASRDQADFQARLADLPERVAIAGASTVDYRALFMPVLGSLVPATRPQSRQSVVRFTTVFAPQADRVGARMLEHAYVARIAPVSVVLVERSPFPGIFAADGRHRGALARANEDTCALAETVFHEAVHFLTHDEQHGHVLATLRAFLQTRDASEDDLEIAENTLVFLIGADLARVLPECATYDGSAALDAFVAEAGPIARAVRQAWTPYVRGEGDRDAAVIALDRELSTQH